MWKTILLYAAALAVAVFALEWLEYQYLARRFGLEILLGVIAVGFAGLGVWAGIRLGARSGPAPFERNEQALDSLGITAREYEVLRALAAGESNKEIARTLSVSPNTVKTHIARLYEKLEVSRRVQAIEKAQALRLIPATGDQTPQTAAPPPQEG
jgi:DNA-binding CsgD family transcriptional regulator